jgi:4-hydroxyphenylpyruvate dioxygenase-like putative hemolysin
VNKAVIEHLGLPPIDQIGFVVKNLDDWVQRYDAIFGPFSLMDESQVSAATFRGKETDTSLKIAFGRSGDVEIEFIEWCSGEGPHSEFIQSGREGLHHLRFRVEDVDHWIEKLRSTGYEPIWYKKWSADTVFVYLENPDDPVILELLQMPAESHY